LNPEEERRLRSLLETGPERERPGLAALVAVAASLPSPPPRSIGAQPFGRAAVRYRSPPRLVVVARSVRCAP